MASSVVNVLIPIYGFFTLCVYSFFLYVFVKNYSKEFRKFPFYKFIPSLALGDFGFILTYSAFIVGYRFVDVYPRILMEIAMFLSTYTFFLCVFICVLMALNRFFALSHPKWNEIFFGASRITRSIAAAHLGAIYICIHYRWLLGCNKAFNPDGGQLFYSCTGNETSLLGLTDVQQKSALVKVTQNILPGVMALVILLIYLRSFLFVFQMSSQTSGLSTVQALQRKKRDRRLLFQGAIIGLTLVCLNLCFNFGKHFFEGALPLLCLTNSLTTPCIFMWYNKVVHKCVLAVFWKEANVVHPSTTQTERKNTIYNTTKV